MVRVAVVLAGLLLATACVTVTVGPITTAPPSPTGSTRPVSAGKGFGLVPDHNGQVVTVDADTDLIRLVLDDGWTWNVVVDPAYLRLTTFGPLQGNGFTAQVWMYKLLQTGETTITATGPRPAAAHHLPAASRTASIPRHFGPAE